MLQHPSVKSLWDDDPPTYEDVLSARRAAALQAGTADNLTETEYRSIPASVPANVRASAHRWQLVEPCFHLRPEDAGRQASGSRYAGHVPRLILVMIDFTAVVIELGNFSG
jgi:hypothetical protein